MLVYVKDLKNWPPSKTDEKIKKYNLIGHSWSGSLINWSAINKILSSLNFFKVVRRF